MPRSKGTVKDNGSGIARSITVLRADSKQPVGSGTSDASTGDFEIEHGYGGQCLALCEGSISEGQRWRVHGPYTPTPGGFDIPSLNPVAHFDAQSLTQLDYETLDIWSDQSGNGHDLLKIESGRGPVYGARIFNGLPGVMTLDSGIVGSDAYNSLMSTAAFSAVIPQPTTWFWVCALSGQDGGVLTDGIDSSNRQVFGSLSSTSYDTALWAGNGGSYSDNFDTMLVKPSVWVGIFDGANSYLRRNGSISEGPVDIGNNSLGGITYGGRFSDQRYYSAIMSEFGVIGSRLTEGEIEALEEYLMGRWLISP